LHLNDISKPGRVGLSYKDESFSRRSSIRA
jgi:hypothetical protein